jgi:AcrR family transcriptional regulator
LSARASLEDISMRELAAHLGVPVMTLYNYVASKNALHVLVLDHVLRPVAVPSPDTGPWDERIRHLERDARRAIAKHPGLSLMRQGLESSEAARLADGVMSILADGGFSPDDAARAVAALYAVTIGQLEIDAIAVTSGGAIEASFEPATSPAHLSREELFDFGLDVVIEGLKAMLTKQRSPRRG